MHVFTINILQKVSSIASLTRRCLMSQTNVRFLSSEVQPQKITEDNKNIELITESATPEKDKLFSRLEIELKGIEPEVMKSYAWFATRAAEHLGIQIGKW